MTQLVPKAFIQDVIARTDIASVIGARVELKKRGNTYMACCPFHQEKTPSFTVSATKQFYYCFGCGAHGDVVKFLTEYDHLSFIDAITDLAQQLGLTVPHDGPSIDTHQNDALYTVMRESQHQFEIALKTSPVAIDYLKNRGLTGKIAKHFGIGFSPAEWGFLEKSSKNKQALATAGMLIEKSPGKYYDRFRNRVMFPIRDTRGRTIAFGGRTLTDEIPKYLNSPETPIFHKSQTLYGLYEALQHRNVKRFLVVEGYLDVISLAQHNIPYAVATLGTALNIKHIQLLLRHTNDVIFCFDGDPAGQKAAWKALTISLPLLRDGLHFRFLFLENKEDPDTLIRKIGQAAFEKLIDTARPLSDVFFDELGKMHSLDDIAGKAAFAKAANEFIHPMPEGIYKNLLLDQLAKKLNLSREKVEKRDEKSFTSKKIETPKFTKLNPAIIAIQLLLQEPLLSKEVSMRFSDTHTKEKYLLNYLIDYFQKNTSNTMSDLLSHIDDEATRTYLASIATLPIHVPDNGRKAEFLGALERLVAHEYAEQLSALITKAKNTALTDKEKQTLQQLLSQKHKTTQE